MPVRKCSGWCGLCYANVRGRENHVGHRGYRKPPTDSALMEFSMRKGTYGQQGGAASGGNPPLSAADNALSVLWEFLTCWKCEGGETRLTGSLTLFCEDGSLKACFNDRDTGCLAFRTLGDLSGALKACSDLLTGNRLDWRHAKEGRGKR